MKTTIFRFCAILLLVLFSIQSTWATCGGGGGGGVGGMSRGGGGGAAPEVYMVPWKVRAPKDPPVTAGLVLYWFPASKEEVQKSSLRNSRILTQYATQCISLELADQRLPNADKLLGDSKLPVAVLATPDGKPVSKLENTAGRLKVEQVEKLVESEVKQRESTLDSQLKEAKEKAKAGDKATAIKLFQSVAAEKCMFKKKAQDAAKELKKLGAGEVSSIPDAPVFEPRQSAFIEQTMVRGLRAEINGRYIVAE